MPYDLFVATAEPALTSGRLSAGTHGHYQGVVLTSSALSKSGSSTLEAAEWQALTDYEVRFGVRRAVLAAWPDPALGFDDYSTQDTTAAPLEVACRPAGRRR